MNLDFTDRQLDMMNILREETGRYAVGYVLRRLFRDAPERMVACLAELPEGESGTIQRKLAKTNAQ